MVADSSSIAALSHIGVQVFGHTHFRWFTHIPHATAQLYTRQFALLPPRRLLLCLRSAAKTNKGQVFEVSQSDFAEFESMAKGVENIKQALDKYGE